MKFIESLKIISLIEGKLYYRVSSALSAPFTGGEHEIPAGTKFCLHGQMRDDAVYMHIIEENDSNLFELLSEKRKRTSPN